MLGKNDVTVTISTAETYEMRYVVADVYNHLGLEDAADELKRIEAPRLQERK